MQEAVKLFEQSHQLYDSLKQVSENLTQLHARLVSDSTKESDSLSMEIGALQQNLKNWHEAMVSVGELDEHDHEGHDHHGHAHQQQEVQLTDQQMLEIQQEQLLQIREISGQMRLLLTQ